MTAHMPEYPGFVLASYAQFTAKVMRLDVHPTIHGSWSTPSGYTHHWKLRNGLVIDISDDGASTYDAHGKLCGRYFLLEKQPKTEQDENL